MKKLIALLLALAMIFSLVACGSSRNDNWDDDDDERYEEEEDEEEEEEEEEAAEEEEDEEEADSDRPALDLFPHSGIVLEEQLLVDNDDCTVQITGIEVDDNWSYNISLFIENKTDTDLTFTTDNTSINGLMCDPFLYEDIPAGKKMNTEMGFYLNDLERCGITEVSVIETTIRAYESGNWDAPDTLNETYTIYPLGEDKAFIQTHELDDDDVVLVDSDDCTVIATGYEEDREWDEYNAMMYVENRTDLNLYFYADNVSVNGIMCDPYWGVVVAPGKAAYCPINWYNSMLEECEIDEVTQIEFTLQVSDNDDWYADYLVDERFALYPLGEDNVQWFSRTPAATDVVVVETEDVSMIVVAEDPDNDMGYALQLFLVNNTDEDVMFSMDDVSVNGFMCDPYWATEVAAGKCAYSWIYWYGGDLEDNGITDIEDMEFSLRVYSMDDWYDTAVEDDFFITLP